MMSFIGLMMSAGPTAQPYTQSGRRERLGDRVDGHGVRRDLRHERHGIHMVDTGRGQHPVHLIVEHVERPLFARATLVLFHDELTDLAQGGRVEHGARRIDRRTQREQARVANDGTQHARRRQEVRARVAFDEHRPRADDLRVIVVVPRRHREHDVVALVDQRTIHGVDRGPRAGRYQHRFEGELQPQPSMIELSNRLSQRLDADSRRIGRFTGTQRVDDRVLERGGNRKLF
jgi:hypothetical protein